MHHRTVPYPAPDKTTPDDLMALCADCRGNGHLFSFYLSAGGSPEAARAARSELVAILLRPAGDYRQVGRAVRFGGDWGALVTGAARPRVGDGFRLFLRGQQQWRDAAVTDVVDGRPGNWRVRKRFLTADGPVLPETVTARLSETVSTAVNL